MAIIDKIAENDIKNSDQTINKFLTQSADVEKLIEEKKKESKLIAEGKHPLRSNKFIYKDGFEYHAEKIMNQVKN